MPWLRQGLDRQGLHLANTAVSTSPEEKADKNQLFVVIGATCALLYFPFQHNRSCLNSGATSFWGVTWRMCHSGATRLFLFKGFFKCGRQMRPSIPEKQKASTGGSFFQPTYPRKNGTVFQRGNGAGKQQEVWCFYIMLQLNRTANYTHVKKPIRGNVRESV